MNYNFQSKYDDPDTPLSEKERLKRIRIEAGAKAAEFNRLNTPNGISVQLSTKLSQLSNEDLLKPLIEAEAAGNKKYVRLTSYGDLEIKGKHRPIYAQCFSGVARYASEFVRLPIVQSLLFMPLWALLVWKPTLDNGPKVTPPNIRPTAQEILKHVLLDFIIMTGPMLVALPLNNGVWSKPWWTHERVTTSVSSICHPQLRERFQELDKMGVIPVVSISASTYGGPNCDVHFFGKATPAFRAYLEANS